MSSSSKWFYTHNGKDKPRVTISQLVDFFNSGKISEKTYVWHKQYCKQWTPINQVSLIMDHLNLNTNIQQITQPSITRNNLSNSKDSLPNLPNLPIIKTVSGSNTSNNTSSELQEIVANEFGQISESDDENKIAPHIIDEQPPIAAAHSQPHPQNKNHINKNHNNRRSDRRHSKILKKQKSSSSSYRQSITNSISYYSNSNELLLDYNKTKRRSKDYKFSEKTKIKTKIRIKTKYKINQLVEINDPTKVGICYGLIVDMTHKKMVIKYNNKAYGTQWFYLNDDRISIVTDINKKQQLTDNNTNTTNNSSEDDSKTDKLNSNTRVVLPFNNNNFERQPSNTSSNNSIARKRKSHSLAIRRKSTILSTVNVNEEKLSLVSERKLLNLQRDEFNREQEKFYYSKKKEETQLWAVKHDYAEQTKKLKKQYNVYKLTCDQLLNQNFATNDMIQYHKLETREKLLRDSQKSVEKKQKTAQILYQTSTHLLSKVQDATMKMEIYSKLCDEKCEMERQLIQKQEVDRKKYLIKMNKLRDEMLSAPWLLLKDVDTHSHHYNIENMEKLHKQLIKTYQAIREERRKFLPVQRKWAKVIAKHQVGLHEEKVFSNVRAKLENIRKYESEYKLKLLSEIKSMQSIDEERMDLKQEDIMMRYREQLLCDRERSVENEKKLLRLQQRNLEESTMELEYERELISAQKSKLETRLNKEKSEQYGYEDMNAMHCKYKALKKELESKKKELMECKLSLQNAVHQNDTLHIQLTSLQQKNNDKEKEEESYSKFTVAMETLTKQFEQMIGLKDDEIKKCEKEMLQWKDKANGLESDIKRLNVVINELQEQNKELLSRNEQLEYTLPQVTTENEHLREQIQEMIITSDEAIKQHQQIDKKLSPPLMAIDDERDHRASDASNYEETAAALSCIRSTLANSAENGRLISKHESQHSMTAIMDLVKKTKTNMEHQTIDLEILTDQPSDNENEDENDNDNEPSILTDDSFSDHLGLIENLLNDNNNLQIMGTKGNDDKGMDNEFEKLNIYLATPDSNDSNDSSTNESSNISSDEPPLFWNQNEMQNERTILHRMIENPNEVLKNVMSPIQNNNKVMSAMYEHSLSDWDKTNSNHSNRSSRSNQGMVKKMTKKRRKSMKKKRRKSNQNVGDKKYKLNQKKRSKKLGKQELIYCD